MTILINPARFRLGADTAIGRLLGDEPAGLAIDFTTGQALIRDASVQPKFVDEFNYVDTAAMVAAGWTNNASVMTGGSAVVISGAATFIRKATGLPSGVYNLYVDIVAKTTTADTDFSARFGISSPSDSFGEIYFGSLAANPGVYQLVTPVPVALGASSWLTLQAFVAAKGFTIGGFKLERIQFMGGVNSLLAYAAPSLKMIWGSDGVLRYGAHNLFLRSNAPANQSVTVISGAQYAVTITGATTTTLSGAATGAIAAGTTTFTAATATLTFGSTTGAGTVSVSRTPVHPGYIPTATAARYGIPLDYDPLTHEPQGALLELAATNKILRSQEFGTTWVPLNATVTSDVAAVPDDTTTGDRLTATSNTTPGISQAVTATAALHTLSVFAKAGTATWLKLSLTTSGSVTNRSAWFDLANGVVGSKEASVVTQQMSPSGNGWHRCSITVTTAAVSETAAIRMVTGNSAVDGTNGATLDLWGAQLEAQSYVTSYIPTTTATVTRVVDSVTLATSAFPYNPTAFTWIAEVNLHPPTTVTTNAVFVRMFLSTTDRFEFDRTPSTSRLTMLTRAANVVTMTEIMSTIFTAGVPHRFATTLDSVLGCSASFDGGAVVSETVPGVVPTNLVTLEFGNTPTGHFRRFVHLPRRAANSELPGMSALAA